MVERGGDVDDALAVFGAEDDDGRVVRRGFRILLVQVFSPRGLVRRGNNLPAGDLVDRTLDDLGEARDQGLEGAAEILVFAGRALLIVTASDLGFEGPYQDESPVLNIVLDHRSHPKVHEDRESYYGDREGENGEEHDFLDEFHGGVPFTCVARVGSQTYPDNLHGSQERDFHL